MTGPVRFLHIGDYKTGTTWLQRHVLSVDPRVYLVGEGQTDLEARLWAALEKLTYSPTLSITEWQIQFNGVMEERDVEPNRLVGISRESMISGDPFHFENWQRSADRMREAFGNVKIIITWRKPSSLIPSLYSTYVKNGGTKDLNDVFLDEKKSKYLIERCDYDLIEKYYINLFGLENCLFLDYELFIRDIEGFVNKFYNYLGISAPTLQLDSTPTVNASLTRLGIRFQKNMNRFVRTAYHREVALPLVEKAIGLAIRCFKDVDLGIEKSRRQYLDDATLDASCGNFPLENVFYISGIRRISEKISVGKKIFFDEMNYSNFIKKDVIDSMNV